MFAIAIVMSNSLFLMLRFFFKEALGVTPNDFEQKHLKHLNQEDQERILKNMRENTDYMQAAQSWISIFVVFASPMFINLAITILSGDRVSEILITYDMLADN